MVRGILWATLIAVIAISVNVTAERPARAAATPVQGDADCGGTISGGDLSVLLRDIAGISTSACVAQTGDTDCDQRRSPADLMPILYFLGGITWQSGSCTLVGSELSGAIVLNEVFFLPQPGYSPFIEFANHGALPASTSGMTLRNEDGETKPVNGEPLPPGGLFHGYLGQTGGEEFVDPVSGFLELYSGDTLVDRVAWGPGQPDAVPLGSGALALEPQPGMSIGRARPSTAIGPQYWTAYGPGIGVPSGPNPSVGVASGSPLGGAILSAESVPFTWYPIAGGAPYRLQVAADEAFTAITVDQPANVTQATASLTPGVYYWRVIAGNGAISPVRPLVVAGTSSAALPAASSQNVQLNVPFVEPRKDTAMLLLENEQQTGDYPWDAPHPGLDPAENSDSLNSFFAAVAAVTAYAGGSVSQDRLAFEAFKGRFPGPERDLLYQDTVAEAQGIAAMLFALGGTEERCSTDAEQIWSFLATALNSGDPLLGVAFGHVVAVDGYTVRQPGGGPAAPERSVHVMDPFVGPYQIDFLKQSFSCLWRPGDGPLAAADQQETADSDGDGIVDFDEARRFGTNPLDDDTDGDGLTDKSDVAFSVFDPEWGYARDWNESAATFAQLIVLGRNWDHDSSAPELDCDSDNDGTRDGADTDNYSPVPPQPVAATCEGYAILTWNADSDLDLYLLPQSLASYEDTFPFTNEPGYAEDEEPDCLKDPVDTLRSSTLPITSSATTHVAVFMFSGCANDPPGPEGDGPHTVTYNLFVQLTDGRSLSRSATATKETDGWHVYGLLPPPQ